MWEAERKFVLSKNMCFGDHEGMHSIEIRITSSSSYALDSSEAVSVAESVGSP